MPPNSPSPTPNSQLPTHNSLPSLPLLLAAALLASSPSLAADLTLTLPPGATAKFAAAIAPSPNPPEEGPGIDGTIAPHQIEFHHLAAKIPYDLKIRLANGVLLHGVDMSWYSPEPSDPTAGPFTLDDKSQITAQVSDVKSFYNISRVLALAGDHNRAVVLVERIRSTDFYHGQGQVIWRVELWYFVNEFGGWQERPQTAKVLRRERFNTHADYLAQAAPIRWLPIIGGLTFPNAADHREISLPPGAAAPPSTQP